MVVLTHLISIFAQYDYIAVFCVLIACGLGIPIPEDIAIVAGGVICGLSVGTPYAVNVNYMIVVSLLGVLIGDHHFVIVKNNDRIVQHIVIL